MIVLILRYRYSWVDNSGGFLEGCNRECQLSPEVEGQMTELQKAEYKIKALIAGAVGYYDFLEICCKNMQKPHSTLIRQ